MAVASKVAKHLVCAGQMFQKAWTFELIPNSSNEILHGLRRELRGLFRIHVRTLAVHQLRSMIGGTNFLACMHLISQSLRLDPLKQCRQPLKCLGAYSCTLH